MSGLFAGHFFPSLRQSPFSFSKEYAALMGMKSWSYGSDE